MENSRGNAVGGEWQTAGKGKVSKPKQPKQQQQPISTTGEVNLVNGHAPAPVVNAGVQKQNNNNNDNSSSYGQNGMVYNGANSRRGGRSSTGGNSSYGGGGGNKSNHHYHTTNNAQYSRPTSSKEDSLSKRKLLEKEAKNIAKRDASIDQVGSLFNDEVAKSRESVQQVFEEIRKKLTEREQAMLEDLDRCKKEGLSVLEQQAQRAKTLKENASHISKLSDRQIDELRSQIRRFMGDRRFEEDLSKPMRFRCELDQLVQVVKTFGEVVPIGGSGVGGEPQKHSSMSSLVSSGDGDGHSASGGSNKAVSEIVVGGIKMKSDCMDADQLAELTRSLRENLKLQGIAEDILPEVCGGIGASGGGGASARRRPAGPPRRDDHPRTGYNNGGGAGDWAGAHTRR